ncbi:hypothetical protein ONE63_006563 [Megalurothrips usitatus]|uniref:Sex-determining region Y protein n=1 Tax=Megalurothrips usitatus TaxID=439358 RepID=A0AAV7XTS8_9NEOP|nr:hypothetical protein ONE63_006563 [Megalurothrips usitatus]
MSVFLRSGCQDKDGRTLGRSAGTIGILGPTRPPRPLQLQTTRTLARRTLTTVPLMVPRSPPSDDITLNSNVFTVCSASISPDPPDDEPARPLSLPRLRRPVVLATTATSTPATVLRKRAATADVQNRSSPPATPAAAAAAVGAPGPFSRKDRIPRPPNAFMLFANEYRKKLSCENPRESNKDISVRLGTMWKSMTKEKKDTYFELARLVDAEHKKKYPDYVYNPKEARLRKAMRDQVRSRSQQGGARTPGASGPASGPGGPPGPGRPAVPSPHPPHMPTWPRGRPPQE